MRNNINKITRIYRLLSEVMQQLIKDSRGTLRSTKHIEVHMTKDREGGKSDSPHSLEVLKNTGGRSRIKIKIRKRGKRKVVANG